MNDAPEWTLAGCGSHGGIAGDLDRPADKHGAWFLDISGPRWSVRFAVNGPEAVRGLLSFVQLESDAPGFASYEITTSEREKVVLAKNSDLGVRFAIVIRGEGFRSEATIQDEDVEAFRRVLEDIVADIADEPKG